MNLFIQKIIKDVLLTIYFPQKLKTNEIAENFDRTIPKNQEAWAYSVMINERNEIRIIASLHEDYKFTRNLSKVIIKGLSHIIFK